MKLSPFTLIYQPEGKSQERSKRRANLASLTPDESLGTNDRLQKLREKAPDLAKALKSLNPNLGRALVASTYAQKLVEPKEHGLSKLRHAVTDLQRSEDVVTVAIWDLAAKIAGLSEVIGAINKVQPTFTFFELRAPLPGGLVIQSEVFSQWAHKRLGMQISKGAQEDFQNNFMFSDFYEFGRVVHKQIGVDYLVAITQHMVAWEDDANIYWNYFTASDRQIILVSAYNMREYAAQAGRPLEVAMAGIIIAQLLEELNQKSLLHVENRGCLFDINEERDTIVESIRKARIEEACLGRIDEQYRDAAEKMIKVLRNYSFKVKNGEEQVAKKTSKNDAYWLTQLTKLSGKLTKAK